MTSVVYHTSLASAVNCIPCQPSCLQFGADHEGWQYSCVIMILNTAGSHAVMASAVCQTAMQLWRLQCANYHRSLAPTVSSILLSAQNSASSVLTAKVDHKIVSTAQQTPTYLQQQNGWTVFCAYCEIVGSQKSEFISVWWHPCSEEHPGEKKSVQKEASSLVRGLFTSQHAEKVFKATLNKEAPQALQWNWTEKNRHTAIFHLLSGPRFVKKQCLKVGKTWIWVLPFCAQ